VSAAVVYPESIGCIFLTLNYWLPSSFPSSSWFISLLSGSNLSSCTPLQHAARWQIHWPRRCRTRISSDMLLTPRRMFRDRARNQGARRLQECRVVVETHLRPAQRDPCRTGEFGYDPSVESTRNRSMELLSQPPGDWQDACWWKVCGFWRESTIGAICKHVAIHSEIHADGIIKVLLYLLRRCYGLIYRLLSSSEPVSEELMPIVRSSPFKDVFSLFIVIDSGEQTYNS